MEESAAPATTATGVRRARKATAKRTVPTSMSAAAMSASGHVTQRNDSNNAAGASSAPSERAGLDAHTASSSGGGGGGSVAFAPNVAHVRNFGRLKSFSSRQRLAPVMQKAARSTGGQSATASATRSAQSSGWTHHLTTPASRSVHVDLSGDTERVVSTSRRQLLHEEEETKESSSTVSVPLQFQQQSQVSVAHWDHSPIASSNDSSPSGMQPQQPQRMRCLKLKSTVHPDLVMPYLYGDRKSRINTIMQDTGCTIDYCPMSPDEESQSPQSRAYIMNFLISAESAENLEEAIRMLRALVEKVEAHLQKKMRIRSLHASSSFRQLEIDRSGADYSDETQEGLLFSGDYDAEYVKEETAQAKADRVERDAAQYSVRPRHPISPVSLETPIEAYRQHSSAATRRRDEINRNVRQDRSARIAVQFDNDIAYYDRWGRPVYRQELSVNGEEFETGSSSDAAREVSRVSYREQVSRLPPHRHWQYVDEPGWSRQNRGYAHVSPAAASEERSTPPSGSARRQKASIHRRYAPYHRNDIYDDDQFEEDLHGHSASREAARVSSFQTDARYSEYENEDLLEHEEDILAAQEYAARSRAQPTYTGRRSAKRPPGQFRQVSPPPYQQKRAAPVDVSSHRAYGYRDGQDGEWLSGDEGHDIVYRRYRYSRQPAMLYPHVYREYQATQGTHRRPDNFSLPDEHPRSAQTESSIARMSKRQKMSSESQGAGIRHAENSDLPFVKSTEDARSYNPDAIDVESDDDVAAPDDETIARQVDYNVPIVYTEHGETSQQPNHVESELVSISSEKRARDAAGESAELEEREKLQDLADEAAPLGKSAIEEDELTGGEQADEKTQQLQACEVVVSLGESGLAAESIIDGAAAVNQEGNARDRAHADTSLPSALLVGISGSDQEIAGETSPVVHQSPEMSTHPPPDSMMASAEPDQVGERADLTQAGVQPAPINPITQHHPSVNNSRTRANELLVASLQMNTSLEAECAQAQEDVKSHLTKYLSVETKSKLLARLDELSRAVFDLQCQVVSSGCKLDTSTRRQMLDVLDGALQTSTRVEKSTQDKIDLLKDGIERALLLCSCDLSVDTQAQDSAVEETFVPNATQSPEIALDAGVFEDSASDDNNWDNTNGWFENADDHYEMEPFEEAEEAVAADADLADDQDMPLVPKKEEDAILTPIESLSFASSLFSETSSCSPTSFVMKGMQKRLLGEIERAHSYYYLHPVNLADPPDSPLKSRSSCEFGCLSGSAGGWVQKVTSQISSRMKWFDEVTYSLARARSGGGNAEAGGELLNRKKMNSTIRKLHLMAIQLHCLVSHLYCIRGRAVCKEGDSLTAALNGSYFERRMTAYKSRLKLDADLHGTPEELLRDTFEFFPEFLLCIEMWGYDYREGTGGDVNRTRKSVKALPLGFFERVEAAVFDYELDKNGFLQTICEELLSIVCLWNDFVWSDNLQTLPVARIAAFEMDMKTSVAKILQTYSLHLMGSWAVRLLANPDELQGLRFTQQNAYYAESSKIRGLVYNSTSHGQCSSGKSSNAAAVGGVTVREEVSAGEYDEELLKKYWALKADASGGRAIQDKSADEQLSSCANISVEAIEKWGKETAAAHLLKWSRVFQLRGELETCGVVLSDLARGVPSQDISSVCGDHVAAAEVLLGIVKKARIVGVDVAAGSDAIALHSASIQLPQEIKLLHEASSGVQKEQNSEGFIAAAVEEEEEQGSRTTEHVDGGGLSEQLSGHGEPPMFSSNSNNNNTSSSSSSSSSDVKDLIQILASTKKEVEEIFCARTRSGRMRDKLQAQSAQLAQQTIDLFHTIAAMRAA